MCLRTLAAIAEPLAGLFLAYSLYSKCDKVTALVGLFALVHVYDLVMLVRDATCTASCSEPAGVGFIRFLVALWSLAFPLVGLTCETTTQIASVVYIVLLVYNTYNFRKDTFLWSWFNTQPASS